MSQFTTEWLGAKGLSVCLGCSGTFKPKEQGQIYCTQSCAASHIGKRTMPRNRKVNPQTQLLIGVCPTCGDKFTYWASHKRIYCSQTCAATNPDLIKKRTATLNSFPQTKTYSRCKKGWVELGDRRFFARSRWEANYGRYLEWLRINKHITDWKHEPETFWFDGIKRGVMSYLPDFKVILNDGKVVFHEVKGWMDSKSKTKLKRMKKYHPTVSLLVLDSGWFKRNSRTMAALIPGWE